MSLDKRALWGCLTRSQPQMKKMDRKVTSEVQVSNEAGAHSGRYNKELYTRKNRMNVEGPMNELYTFWRSISHAWMERGWVIVPITLYDKSKDILARLVETVVESDRLAGDNFPQWKSDGEIDLGLMWREGDYPTQKAFAEAFAVEIILKPVPVRVPSNLLYSLLEEDKTADIDAVKKMIQESEAENLLCVTESCAKRVYDATLHIIEGINHKQTPKKPGSKRDNNYRDSLVGNVWDLVQILPELNLADSPQIESLYDALKSDILGKLDLENVTVHDIKKRRKAEHARMRNNPTLENEMKKEAENIMAMAEAILPKADDNS